MTFVKICGVTSVEDARACVAAGVDAIGLNFVPSSVRAIDRETAKAIARAVGDGALLVGVVADLDLDAMRRLAFEVPLGCLQLHGHESPAAVEALLPHAYKAIAVADAHDAARADDYPGEHILVDAKVAGSLGGTGVLVDWTLVEPLARRRNLTLAGGLRPSNVAAAVAAVRPFAVDVASGVETAGTPRRKDLGAIAAFVRSVRDADARMMEMRL